MARMINLLCLIATWAMISTMLIVGADAASATAEKRVRKCRHISATDPFPQQKDYSILYPHISEVTMRTHFHSHQVAGYIGKLNTFLKGIDGAPCPDDENSLLMHFVREFPLADPLRKHAHQAYNHALYFAMLRKNRTLVEVRPAGDDEAGYVRVDGVATPPEEEECGTIVTIHGQTFRDTTQKVSIEAQPELAEAIKKTFGSVDAFKTTFVEHAINHFASGWIWLVVDPKTKAVSIAESHDGDTFNSGHTEASHKALLDEMIANAASANESKEDVIKKFISADKVDGRVPLAVLDVWEHAYYLDYQSKRKDYVESWLNAVDWSLVARRMNAADFEIPKEEASPKKDYSYSVFY